MKHLVICIALLTVGACCFAQQKKVASHKAASGNPVFQGWYADPEGIIYDDTYWIFPTWSDLYENQTFFDCFSSKDLVNWTKHASVLDTTAVKWAKKAMWAPSVIRKNGKYYIFFGANSQKVVAAGRPKTTAAADQDGCCGRLTGDTAHDHNRVEGDHQQEG